ncbi:hypothetical protein BY458DRAFT_123240 [Sporodiniella umbellata]|nr:hypothetical protein BY458DRAFT_123240 [Sporodiniella umbellata]
MLFFSLTYKIRPRRVVRFNNRMNDDLWMYKDFQGLRDLDKELELLRSKRYSRNNLKENTSYLKEINVFDREFINRSSPRSSFRSEELNYPCNPSWRAYNRGLPSTLTNTKASSTPSIPLTESPEQLPLKRQDSDRCSLYLPQLSPEHKFMSDDLSEISTQNLPLKRPINKKRVSFSEELIFFPLDEEKDDTLPKTIHKNTIMKELLYSLNHTSVDKPPVYDFRKPSRNLIPAFETNPAKEIVPTRTFSKSSLEKQAAINVNVKKGPQKLSNKLLDMFQPIKSKTESDSSPPKPELVHPPSLKKNSIRPTTTYNDWRTTPVK